MTIRELSYDTPLRYSGLSTDTKPTDKPAFSKFYEIDTGNVYEFDGNSWLKSSAGGAANVNSDFTPSSYSGNKSATTTVAGQSEALATGVTKVRFANLDATNFCLVSFGTSASNAETNAANGVAIELAKEIILSRPANATHIAWLGDTGTVVVNVIQGV